MSLLETFLLLTYKEKLRKSRINALKYSNWDKIREQRN